MNEQEKMYDKVYKEGAYENFYTFKNQESVKAIIDSCDWDGKTVLEIGCGEGDLAAQMAFYGAEVYAIDTSKEAVDVACERYSVPNCRFLNWDYKKDQDPYDIVVMNGVLEHVEDPFETLKYIRGKLLLKGKPTKIISCSPSFLNPRGYIWMALQLLFDVPMSLSDVHFILPSDMQTCAHRLGGTCSYKSCDYDWGNGPRLIVDFRKRLTNALRDAKMDNSNVDKLLEWLEKAIDLNNAKMDRKAGANIVYRIDFE